MKPVNFSDLDIANIVEAVIKDDPDAIVIKDSLAKSLSQLREMNGRRRRPLPPRRRWRPQCAIDFPMPKLTVMHQDGCARPFKGR